MDIMGFTAGFQSGLTADDREKERILKAIREGKSVSPVLSFVRASGEGVAEVLWNMATASFVAPLDLAKEMVDYTMAVRNERQAVAIAQEQERQARNARWESFDRPYSPESPSPPTSVSSKTEKHPTRQDDTMTHSDQTTVQKASMVNDTQFNALLLTLQTRVGTYKNMKAQYTEAANTVMDELQKVATHCASSIQKDKAALEQRAKILQAKGEISPQEAEMHNAQLRAVNARGSEYNQFLQSTKSDKGHSILMAQNMSCSTGAGFNAEATKSALLHAMELQRTMALHQAEINRLSAQVMALKDNSQQVETEEKAVSNAAKTYDVSTWTTTIVHRFRTQPGEDMNKPFTLCGLTLYAPDGTTAEGLNKGLYQEALAKKAQYKIYESFDLVTSCSPHLF